MRALLAALQSLFIKVHSSLAFFTLKTGKSSGRTSPLRRTNRLDIQVLQVVLKWKQDKKADFERKFTNHTYTGLLTNLLSFSPFSYKLGLIRTLVDRTSKINSTWAGFSSMLRHGSRPYLGKKYKNL